MAMYRSNVTRSFGRFVLFKFNSAPTSEVKLLVSSFSNNLFYVLLFILLQLSNNESHIFKQLENLLRFSFLKYQKERKKII